jgi:hypothetical protein
MKIAILAKTAQRTNVFDDTYFDRMRKHGELSIFNQDDFNDRAYLLDVCRGANVIITTWGMPRFTMCDSCRRHAQACDYPRID